MMSTEKQVEDLVTVIIPTFNSTRFISDTLDSVWAQTHRPIEIVVVDDGSADDTVPLVNRWFSASRGGRQVIGRLLRQEHRGGGAARNLGLASASGKWTQFLDSDDLLAPDKIAHQLSMLAGTERAIAYCAWRYMEASPDGFRYGQLRQASAVEPNQDLLRMHIEGWYCPSHCYLWPSDVLREIGGFDPSLAADQDGDLVMRALMSDVQLKYCAGTEVAYRMYGTGQVSQSPDRSKFRSRLRVVRKLETQLTARGQVDQYRESIAIRCDDLERATCLSYPAIAMLCRDMAQTVSPGHRRIARGGVAYRLARQLVGLRASEWLALQRRRVQEVLREQIKRGGTQGA